MITAILASLVSVVLLGLTIQIFYYACVHDGDIFSVGMFTGVVFFLYTFGILPNAFPSVQIANTELLPEHYTIYKNVDQLGVVYNDKVIKGKDYIGFKALSSGELKVFEQKYESCFPLRTLRFSYIRAFDYNGNLIGETERKTE